MRRERTAGASLSLYIGVMHLRPRCYAINEVIGSVSSGLSVVALGMEVWPDRVVVSLGALADDTSDALLHAYQEQFAEWAVQRQGRPPRQPAEALVDELQIDLRDAVGTVFKFAGAATGGTGTEWAATRLFTPAPAGDWLALSFVSPSGSREVTVDLGAQDPQSR